MVDFSINFVYTNIKVYPLYILLGGQYMNNSIQGKESIFISQTFIKKWGNSQGIRLSKDIINMIGCKENDKVEISVDNGRITIKKAAKEYINLKERLEAFYKKPIEDIFVENIQEVDVGAPVGEEYW